MKNNYITQLDYIRILLEEEKYGEALNNISHIKNNLETQCENILNNIDIDIDMLKTDLKPGMWYYINQTWLKFIGIKNNFAIYEIANGIEISKPLNESSQYTYK